MKRLLWVGLVLFASGMLLGPAACAQEISVQDIVAGIEARRSKVETIRVHYEHRLERHPFFYEMHQRFAELSRRGEISKDAAPPDSPDMPRETRAAYTWMRKGDHQAFEVYSFANGQKSCAQRGVFDGQTIRLLEPARSRGFVKRAVPRDVVQFPVMSSAFELDGADFAAYVADPALSKEVTLQVMRAFLDAGDACVAVRLERALPVQGAKVRLTKRHDLVFNASKDFWPIRIVASLQVEKADNGEIREIPTREVSVQELKETNGLFYPLKVQAKVLAMLPAPFQAGQILPPIGEYRPLSTETFLVQEVAINSSLSDADFTLEFPKGTQYVDRIAGATFVVDEDGTVKDLAEKLGKPLLPVGQYSREQAAKIFAEHRKQRLGSERPSGLKPVLTALSILLVFGWGGYWVARRYRRRQT